MSSYQFVNTLAQCYAEQQNAAASAGQTTNQQMDYYNMNYPNSYSPNLGNNYNQYSLMMSGQAAAAMASMSASVSNSAADTYSMTNSGGGPAQAGTSAQQQTPPQNSLPRPRNNHSPTMNNCANKYEATGLPPGGSPQDLRTSSEAEGTPQPKTPSSPSAASQPPLSPLLSSNTSNVASAAAASAAVAAAAAAAAAQAAANSSNSSSSSNNVSSNSGSGSGGGSGGTSGNRSSKQNSSNSTASEDGKTSSSSGGNPPQIYPWMKRAHLGQSKFPFTFQFFQFLNMTSLWPS